MSYVSINVHLFKTLEKLKIKENFTITIKCNIYKNVVVNVKMLASLHEM